MTKFEKTLNKWDVELLKRMIKRLDKNNEDELLLRMDLIQLLNKSKLSSDYLLQI